jgi:predicted ATP-dependent endonuclease of OLD family
LYLCALSNALNLIMTAPQIRIKTQGFRAIGDSDIIINGITVVAGENGSGKSTISKLLYYLYKTAANYDFLIAQELQLNLNEIFRVLDIAHHEIYPISKDKNIREDLRKELYNLSFRSGVKRLDTEQQDAWLSLIKKTSDLLQTEPDLFNDKKEIKRNGPRIQRLRYILEDVLNKNKIPLPKDNSLGFEQLAILVQALFKEAKGKAVSRPASLFINALRSVFTDGQLPKLFEVLEFDEEIISLNKPSLSIPYSVQKAIYIDTPMMLGVDTADIEHWDDLNDLLNRPGKANNLELSKTISNSIIHGDISLNDSQDFGSDFSYKREDGSVYNLLDCATGVKSFGILQLLLKNGSLTDKTLLIIDEPESHLHPQWIIEYAHLIVLLNKITGVKFFIASHNPDMVSAIKHIAEKEGIISNLNFYLAEQVKNKFTYNYRHLGTDIDPIFGSFNIALERIHEYGS